MRQRAKAIAIAKRIDEDRAERARQATQALDAPALTLFDALRAWRKDEASRQGKPPYVIFHDATLREVAERRPRGVDELAEITGVGAKKLSLYGDALLEVVAANNAPFNGELKAL